jgi:hypothetical protein
MWYVDTYHTHHTNTDTYHTHHTNTDTYHTHHTNTDTYHTHHTTTCRLYPWILTRTDGSLAEQVSEGSALTLNTVGASSVTTYTVGNTPFIVISSYKNTGTGIQTYNE